MKAVGLYRNLPIDDPESLVDLELPKPAPAGRELLVEVKAISVNPVDYKVRARPDPNAQLPRILGWDVAGVVREVGNAAELFKPGDEVYYAGSINRPGANSEFHVVDERIVGHKPRKLGFAAAALHVIGTASRPESSQWIKELGVDAVVDHTGDLAAQMRAAGVPEADCIFCLTDATPYFPRFAPIIRPQGKLCLIVSQSGAVELTSLMQKSVSIHWELMFTRSLFQTADMQRQHEILERAATLIDNGTLRTTLAESLGAINAANLRRAHQMLERGRTIGKLVLEGFDRDNA
jgi:NADPH2:quinone reductase